MNDNHFMTVDQLVRGLAKTYVRVRGVLFNDLVQEGWLAALQAEPHWDPERGKKLAAYLYPVVWRAMRELATQQRAPVAAPKRKALNLDLANSGVELHDVRGFTPSPEDELWRKQVRAQLEVVLGRLRHGDAVARVLLLGDKPRGLAREAGATPRQLQRQTNKARNLITQDSELRALSEP